MFKTDCYKGLCNRTVNLRTAIFFSLLQVLAVAVIFFCIHVQSLQTVSTITPTINSTTPGPVMPEFSEEEIANLYAKIKAGGRRKAHSNKQFVAIIVPYRNRASHLAVFLRHMHSFLSQQPINYGIFIVEQISNQTFNRGKLMNVGFLEAIKEDVPWNCFFFHDVDLLPLNPSNIYKCEFLPKHYSSAIDKYNYSIPYHANFGGVTAMFRSFFERMNGFSNLFWGWGAEDDEFRRRVSYVGTFFYRISSELGRYKMHKHLGDVGNEAPPMECRLKLLNTTITRFHLDGLNSANYTVLKKQQLKLYTHILVDLHEKWSKKYERFRC